MQKVKYPDPIVAFAVHLARFPISVSPVERTKVRGQNLGDENRQERLMRMLELGNVMVVVEQ